MFNAGQVAATLSGNFSPAGFLAFDGAMRKAGATMDATEKKMAAAGSRGGKALAMVGKAGALAAAGGILAFGLAVGKSVKLAADFEQQMSRLSATLMKNGAKPAAKDMDLLKKAAMDAGAATKFSALDAAKAQVELAKGGLSVAKISGGALKAALALAAAGEMDLAEAAATTVNAMKQFKLPAEDAVHVADALSTAANTTTADVDHFAMALAQGGAAAKAAGLSLDETVAILEVFADGTIKSSDAGTSLKAMLTQLAGPTDKQKDAAKALNLELWTQNGRLKSLPAVAKELDDAFGGLTKRQQLAAAKTLVGTDGMRGLLELYASSPAKMRAYLDGLKEEGTAAATAAEKQDNLRGKIENLKGSLETAAIAFGSGLLPALTDGTGSLTDTINELVESGKLEEWGEDFGNALNDVIAALPGIGSAIGDAAGAIGPLVGLIGDIGDAANSVHLDSLTEKLAGLGGIFKTLKGVVSGDFGQIFSGLQQTLGGAGSAILGTFSSILSAAAKFTGVMAKIPGIGGAFRGLSNVLQGTADGIDGVREKLRGLGNAKVKDVSIKVTAQTQAATAALKSIDSKSVQAKVLRILGNNSSAAAKVKQIVALGIPTKTARILANNAQALSAIGGVAGAIAALPSSKTVTLTTINRVVNQGVGVSSKPPKGSGVGKRAAGKGPGGAERSLVAEGRGPELVARADGSYVWVTQPTLMDLGDGDAVIPSDPQYSRSALGFMFAALGVPGYAKGKAPAKKKAAKALPIPDAVRFGAVPEDQLSKERDSAREAYQKRKDRIHDLDVDIREQRKKVGEAKGPAKTKARRKLADLQADKRRYANGGSGVPNSLAELRAKWEDLKRQFSALHRTNLEIERLNKQQETDRTLMATASKKGDAAGWTKARDHRGGLLVTLRDMYARAVKLAKPDSNFKAELEGQLASIEGEIADAAGEAFAPDGAAGRLSDTGMTDAERQRLAELERDQALAGLTATLDDDKAAAGRIAGFFEGILGAVQADPARGGAATVRDIADKLKQARDNVASFAGGGAGNDNADLQAQLDQAREQTRVATEGARINAQALTVFQGWQGGGGPGGFNGPNITVNTLHPGDSRTLEAIGNAATAGQSQQASRLSSRTYLGL